MTLLVWLKEFVGPTTKHQFYTLLILYMVGPRSSPLPRLSNSVEFTTPSLAPNAPIVVDMLFKASLSSSSPLVFSLLYFIFNPFSYVLFFFYN